MSPFRVTIHDTGSGVCSLTGKQSADGLTVTFEDGTVKESFLSWRAFRQLLSLKTGAKPAANGKADMATVSTGNAGGK